VVHISVDGLRSDVVTAEHMPVLTELLARSSSTLEARSDVTVTKTLPNHLSQFTGRPAATAEGHGVTFNQDNGGTVHEFSDSDYVASIFDVVHDRGDRTVAFVGKSKFYLIERSWNAEHGAPDEVGDDDGPAKIDYFKKGAPNWLDDDLLDELEIPGTRYAFFHIRTPDKGGHDFGWGSPEYLDAVTDADALLGEILDRVSQSPLVADGTIFVVTSDHGGPTGGDQHSDASNPENYVIPFVVHDPDWTESFDLYDLNPERLRPLADANPPEAIRTLDVANLVTGLLGHPPVNPDGPQMLQVR
jgi:predicted AlkP superfamily pyrophosphatase or phosphodiesterase